MASYAGHGEQREKNHVLSVERARLASHGLDEHSDGHSRGERVGIDDAVGSDAGGREGHVDLRPQHGEHAFLAVSRGELIAHHGVAVVSEFDVHALHAELGIAVQNAHFVHVGGLRRVVEAERGLPSLRVVHRTDRIAFLDVQTDRRQAVGVQSQRRGIAGRDGLARRPLEDERLGRRVARIHQVDIVAFVDRRVREAAFEGGFVQDHGVLEVVARVANHRHHAVHALRVRIEQKLPVQRVVHQRSLRRLQSVHLGVRAMAPREARRSHRLLAHLALIHVTRRLVEVRKRSQRRQQRQHVRRRDLDVCRHALSDIFLHTRDF